MHLYVFDDTDTVVAADEEDAWAVWCENTGERREDYEPSGTTPRRLDDEETVTIRPDPHAEEEEAEVATAAEWAQRNGRGFLCSTEW